MMVMVNTRLWKSAIANVAQHVSATRRGCVTLIETICLVLKRVLRYLTGVVCINQRRNVINTVVQQLSALDTLAHLVPKLVVVLV